MAAITSHYVDKDFIYHEDLLSFEHVAAHHTGKNLAAHMYKVLHEFNIQTKLFCITTDSASNNRKMMKELSKLLRQRDSIKWNGLTHHIRCLAHVINLAVKAFLINLKVAPLSEEFHWLSNQKPRKMTITMTPTMQSWQTIPMMTMPTMSKLPPLTPMTFPSMTLKTNPTLT